jgi:hypothetical protein
MSLADDVTVSMMFELWREDGDIENGERWKNGNIRKNVFTSSHVILTKIYFFMFRGHSNNVTPVTTNDTKEREGVRGVTNFFSKIICTMDNPHTLTLSNELRFKP